MNVDYELLQRGCLMARENRLKQERIREATPERKSQHKRWAQSEDGKRSMRERHRRYRATENGREMVRLKSLRFYERHKDDPAFKVWLLERGHKLLEGTPAARPTWSVE